MVDASARERTQLNVAVRLPVSWLLWQSVRWGCRKLARHLPTGGRGTLNQREGGKSKNPSFSFILSVVKTASTRMPRARARTNKPPPTAGPLSPPPTGQTDRPTEGRANPAGTGEEPRNAAEREYRGGTERRDEGATRATDAQRERTQSAATEQSKGRERDPHPAELRAGASSPTRGNPPCRQPTRLTN